MRKRERSLNKRKINDFEKETDSFEPELFITIGLATVVEESGAAKKMELGRMIPGHPSLRHTPRVSSTDCTEQNAASRHPKSDVRFP